MPAHAKDIGISNENIGLLISLTMVIDLISKILVGVIADRKLVRTPTILVIVSIVMGTTSHLLRYVNSFSSLVIFVVVVGK
jgi:sugar phosphate permease